MPKTKKGYKFPRKYSKKYCKKTACKDMGFTQRSSCRPYKNCFAGTRRKTYKKSYIKVPDIRGSCRRPIKEGEPRSP